jgi:hypothetical protein
MKKLFLAVILAVILVLSLCACAGNSNIDRALVGTWEGKSPITGASRTLEFSANGSGVDSGYGMSTAFTWKVENNRLHITYGAVATMVGEYEIEKIGDFTMLIFTMDGIPNTYDKRP